MFFLQLSCFFDDPMDVGNLISGSSAFSKSSLNIWNFTVHVLLKPGLENFEHYFTSMWDECNCAVVWTLFGTGMKTDLFQSCGHCWVFKIDWHVECSTFTASSFRIWNSSTWIPSPPLGLFIVMLLKAHLTSHSRMSGSMWMITCDYLRHEDLFYTVLLCILATSSYLQLLPGPCSFCPLLCPIAQFYSWVRKICWRRDTLPSPVFLSFPCD